MDPRGKDATSSRFQQTRFLVLQTSPLFPVMSIARIECDLLNVTEEWFPANSNLAVDARGNCLFDCECKQMLQYYCLDASPGISHLCFTHLIGWRSRCHQNHTWKWTPPAIAPCASAVHYENVLFNILTATLASSQTLVFGGLIVCTTSRTAEDLNMSTAEVIWLSVCPPSESSPTLPNLGLTSSKPFLTSFHLEIREYRNCAANFEPQTGFRLLTILW